MNCSRGEKGEKHTNPEDPPRRRANKRKGRGTFENDRPPILGVVGRQSGQIRITVCDNVKQTTRPDVSVYTDENQAYDHLSETGRSHSSVNHSQKVTR